MNVPSKINQWMYPYTEQVKNYPIFLTGIGGTQYQGHTKRPEGYYWHQILYCGSGNGLLKYDDVTVNITKGSFFFLPAYYPHEYFSEDDKWEVCWVVFDGYDCNRILNEMKLTKPVVIAPDDSTALNKLFEGVGGLNDLGVEIGINGGEKAILQPHLTKGGGGKQIHTAKEGGFSRARGSDNGDHLALFDMAVNSVQYGDAVFKCLY